MSAPLLTEREALALLDAHHSGWKRDREGWVNLERCRIKWRVHYSRGELLEIGWWGTLEDAAVGKRRDRDLSARARPPAA